ncbi:MAG: ATP-binding protein [Thermoguttaceae bacterium]
MNGLKWDYCVVASAIVLAGAWPLGWHLALGPDFAPPTIRLVLMAAGMIPAAAVAWFVCRRRDRRTAAAEAYLAALCRTDLHDLWPNDRGTAVPPPSADRRCTEVLSQVREAFRRHGRIIQDLEQTRSSLELRAGRAVAEADEIKAILSGLPEPILAVDGYGELTLVNQTARRLLRTAAEGPESRALQRVVECQKLVDLLLGTSRRRSGGSRSEEIELPDAEGKPHWYRVTAARLAAAGGSAGNEPPASGAVAVLQDIADRRALVKRNAEFVSSVSHEMKTPLAGIMAYVELLADGDAEDEATREEFLGVIKGQADRLQRLVENLLNLARIEAGVVKVSKEPRSLNAVLEEALGVVRPSAEAKGIELASDLSPLYLDVLADHDLLLQAAINLLSNAIKYTPSGGRVTLRSRLEEGQVRFDVQDTGVGLSEEDCTRVFEKFYRVNKSKDMASGTGLGLPLAKHIVEDVHGGRLAVTSAPGEGSTFAVTLPNVGAAACGFAGTRD